MHENILNKDLVGNGIVEKSKFEDSVKDEILIALLRENKVIFFDEHHKEYIIPNYLPILNTDSDDFFIFHANNEPDLVLKFEHFIPFGFINQLICHFGQNPDKKTYRRNHLIFTLDKKIKVMIHLNFEYLRIEVSLALLDKNLSIPQHFLRGLLYVLVDMYYGRKIVLNIVGPEKYQKNPDFYRFREYSEIERYSSYGDRMENEDIPIDLYVSLNNRDFVQLAKLEDKTTIDQIMAYEVGEQGKLLKDKARGISTYPFKQISFNENVKIMKKIFISYSKYDEDYKIELVDHLVTLRDEGLIDDFNCDQIDLGDNSHEVIQQKLAECDFMLALVSVKFLNTPYIREFEVEKAKTLGKKIIPIIIKPCYWENSIVKDFHAALRGTNISLDKSLFLRNQIKETSEIERNAWWTKVVQELRAKIFKK